MISGVGMCKPTAKPSIGRTTIAAGSAATRRIEAVMICLRAWHRPDAGCPSVP